MNHIKPKSLFINNYNREIIASALEVFIAAMKESGCPPPADLVQWSAFPAKIRAGLTPVFVGDIGDFSAWENALC